MVIKRASDRIDSDLLAEGFTVWSRASLNLGPTVDDIKPALPIVRNIP